MKKVNLGFTVKLLDGTDVTIQGTQDLAHAGWYLSQILISQTKEKDILKCYDWALKLHNREDIMLDEQDFKKFYSIVQDSEQLTVLIKAQIMKYLDTVK